jgi:nucleotide sugar dehydrogenase
MAKMLIGFIGQGWIGKNYADDFERRGYDCVRYSLEPTHIDNKERIRYCDIVFIAVPTPTLPGQGFDDSSVRAALYLVGEGKIAVIKSTIIPGTTEALQNDFAGKIILHSPEFLSEATAADDASHPVFNIIGTPRDDGEFRAAASAVMDALPEAKKRVICSAREAEVFKYLRNCFFYTKVVYMNMVYDAAQALGAKWEVLRDLLGNDPWIANMHLDPVHKTGRGAGGHCFIKDFAALEDMYEKLMPEDQAGKELLQAFEKKNTALLKQSGKDVDILREVYGEI